jgi:hypothetical protein
LRRVVIGTPSGAATEIAVLIISTIYALIGGLILQRLLGCNFSRAYGSATRHVA